MDNTDSQPQSGRTGRRQDAATLETAFAQYQGELLGTLFYLVGNLQDAQDALQETFVKCWRNRGQLGRIRNVRAWIFRIAVNTGRDARGLAGRRKRQPLAGNEQMLVADEPTPDAILERNDQLARVRKAVLELRPEEQEVFLLRQNGEMTYDEIAETLGIPVGTAKTRMRRALSQLRAALVV